MGRSECNYTRARPAMWGVCRGPALERLTGAAQDGPQAAKLAPATAPGTDVAAKVKGLCLRSRSGGENG